MTIHPGQLIPIEDEAQPQIPLIFCEKTERVPGFSKITLSPEISDETPEQTKQKIVDQLESKKGLTVQFQKGNIIKTLTFKNVPTSDCLARIVALNKNDKRVHYTSIAGSQAIRKGKGNAEQIEQYKGLGIAQIAVSLGIEVVKLTDPNIQTIHGTAETTNTASILSRLHSPNISEGNYFTHNITDSDIKNRVFISTFLYEPSTIEQIKKINNYPIPAQ